MPRTVRLRTRRLIRAGATKGVRRMVNMLLSARFAWKWRRVTRWFRVTLQFKL